MGKILSPQGSGYFPTCLSQNATLATHSITDAMEMYWKVRSWTVTISGYCSGYQVFISTASDETSLVCQSSFLPSINTSFFDENAFYLGGPSVDSILNPQKYAMVPAFAVVCQLENDGGSVIISSEFYDEPGNFVIVGSFSFYGKSYRLFGGEGSEGGLSGSVIPSAYWSYGGTYDTATGAPL